MTIKKLTDSGNKAGAISSSAGIGVAMAADRVVVTAVRAGNGNLLLIPWKISDDGTSIKRLPNDSGTKAGTVSLLDMASATSNRFVTAVRAGNGNLLIIAWQVNTATGEVTRLKPDSGSSEGAISFVTMAESPLGDGRVLIAVRDGGGNLVVKHWEVESDGALNRVGDTALQDQPTGAISLVAIGEAGSGKIVTAVRDGAGNLKLIAWQVQSTGGIKRLGDSGQQAKAINLVDIGAGEGFLVTAVRVTSVGNLKLISWTVSQDGLTVKRVTDSEPGGQQAAGSIDRLSCVSIPPVGNLFDPDPSRIVTAVRTGGSLKLITWKVGKNGALTRTGDDFTEPGTISLVRLIPVTSTIYLTAVRDSNGNLKLITWQI